MKKFKTTEQFVREANEIHHDKYNYSKVEYTNSKTKVCIICPEHGEFWQEANSHLKGCGCPKCAKVRHSYNNVELFINESIKLHGDKFDYSKVDFSRKNDRIKIICPIHGWFETTPHIHLLGCDCPKCVGIAKLSNEEFIEKSKSIHGNKYDYSKVDYKNNRTKVCIICPEHGEFWQTPHNHLIGQGCPKCKERKLEKEVRESLEKHNIKYIFQASKKDIKWIDNLRLDFYLPDYKVAIECQGEQHFIPVDFAGRGIEWAKRQLKDSQKRDKKKFNICKKNNIELLYYTNFKRKNMFNQLNKLIECITAKRILQNLQIVKE